MVARVMERALANFAEEVTRANDSGAKYCSRGFD